MMYLKTRVIIKIFVFPSVLMVSHKVLWIPPALKTDSPSVPSLLDMGHVMATKSIPYLQKASETITLELRPLHCSQWQDD
jgi:hypothetical protein